MPITISKQDFERALPVGTSAHDNVFENVRSAIEDQLEICRRQILGPAGEAIIESEQVDPLLIASYKRMVCLRGFLYVFRQLDLVLTPTGFGIVSNQQVSPASKQRVDALEAQLHTLLLQSLGLVLQNLMSEQWGKQQQARLLIRYLYDEHAYCTDGTLGSTYQDWMDLQPALLDADQYLRRRISDELMDDVLDAYRCKDMTRVEKYYRLIQHVRNFVRIWKLNGPDVARDIAVRAVINLVESDLDTYSMYAASSAYIANHTQRYENTKDSTAYFFG